MDWTDVLAPQDWHDVAYHEVYEAFMNTDWTRSLGMQLSEWPETLRIMVYQLFATDAPAVIHWGCDQIQIYNAALRQTLAKEVHPHMMGQSWQETWQSIVPNWERSLEVYAECRRTGRGAKHKEVTVCMTISEIENEEKIYDYSHIAIRSALGKVEGNLVTLEDRTESVVKQRIEKSLITLQETVSSAVDVQELFGAIQSSVVEIPLDVPCIAVYHCEHPLRQTEVRTYSRVAAIGVSTKSLPDVVVRDLTIWSDMHLSERSLYDYFAEVIYTGRSSRLTDQRLISGFCERRAFGDITKTVIIYPIYCFGQEVPTSFVLQGLNPRRNQAEESTINLFRREIGASIEIISKRAAISSQLHATTAELLASQQKFDTLIRACPTGIYVLNVDTMIFEFVNDAYFELTGISKIAGPASWEAYMHQDSLLEAQRLYSIMSTAPVTNFEAQWRIPWPNGTERWTSNSSILHQDSSGTRYVFGVFSDLSPMRYALKVEKDRADAAVRTKQQQLAFLDMIAHELRNPLGAIMQQSDFLVEKLDTKAGHLFSYDCPRLVTEEDVEDLRTIGLCAQHMSRIINDTLNLSKLEGGMLIATPVPTQPLAVLKSVLAMFDAEIRRSEITMKLVVEDSFRALNVGWVRTDPSRFAQIIINLLANAIKFLGKMSTREISVTLGASVTPMTCKNSVVEQALDQANMSSKTPSCHMDMIDFNDEMSPMYITCRIRDTGPGMDDEQVGSLFQRYFQASPLTHVGYGGSGLGLFISKQLVDLLGGQIDVESVKNSGTTFVFSIRTVCCEAPRRSSTQELDMTDSPMSSTNLLIPDTILIAEDNLINQKIMQKQMSSAGFKTIIANNGQELINILVADRQSTQRIALCLCDVEMPVLGGIEAVREVRRLENNGFLKARCPFIAVTANARDAQIAAMLGAGMDDTLSKPFRFNNLLSKMTTLMARLQLSSIPRNLQNGVHGSNGGSNNLKRKSPSNRDLPTNEKEFSQDTFFHSRISDLWSNSADHPLDSAVSLVMLNTPPPSAIAALIWQRAALTPNCLKICTDGATDRLHKDVFRCEVEDLKACLHPDVILGDFDSINPETKYFYESRTTTKVIEIRDQNSTDFTKAIKFCMASKEHAGQDIIVLGGIDGRLDQTFSTLNSLFLRQRIYVIDSTNIVILLKAGSHVLDCTGLGIHCGLVPMQGPVKCWNSGLEWCLSGETMEMGQLISTNNRVVSEDHIVSIRCDGPVLFSIELDT